MNTFNKKSLYAAIAGLSALGVAGTADAVYVNPDGLGQVLIYPYYTVRAKAAGTTFAGAQFNTLISVVNTTASAKAVKVRFLENLDSREVLDFNLYLSHNDVWTAGVVPTAAGAGVVTFDKSCTDPPLASGTVYPFVNTLFTETGIDSSLDRTREGYIEIIEMGDIATAAFVADVTHASGVPACKIISGIAATDTVAGTGGIFGDLTIINVNATAETATDAVALNNFNTASSIWAAPGSINPTLQSGSVLTSESFKGGGVVVATWTQSIDAVSASMMHDQVMNEYILDSGTKSGTDWVVNFPTKRYYYNANGTLKNAGLVQPPQLFQRNFGVGGACDDVGIQFWDREEQTPGGPLPTFSPPSPATPPSALCWEANIVTFNSSNVFSSPYSRDIKGITFQDGWLRLNLVGGVATAGVHQMISVGAQTFLGLPVVGFATATFFNGTLPPAVAGGASTQSAYGGSWSHKFTSN